MNKTPFTKEQVDSLNKHQQDGRFHPYTCKNQGDDAHIKYEFEKTHKDENYEDYIEKEKQKGFPYPEMLFTSTSLIATENGWICPVCDYTQNWSH